MERPEQIVRRLPLGIARLDRAHRLVEVNDVLTSTLEMPRERLIGRTCRELEPDADYFGQWDAALDRCFETGEAQRVTRMSTIRGRAVLVDFRFVLDDDPDQVLGMAVANVGATVLRDLLDNRETLLRTFLDHAPVFAWLRGADDHTYRMVNRTYLDHYGLRPDDVLGRTVQDRWPGPVGLAFAANDAEVAASGEPGRFYEFAPDPDGTMHQFLNVKFPFRDADGNPLIGAVGMDVTEHERLEKRLSRLEEAQDTAALALGAVHDLANDLMVIRTLAQKLRRGGASAEHERLIAATDRATDRLQSLRRTRAPAPEFADLEATLASVVEELSSTAPIRVSWSGQVERDVRIHADELRRVFDNLLRNAAEACGPDGRVEISIHRVGPEPESPVLVRVRDNGPGVPAELAPNLFDALVSTKGEGRGLGLAGVRALLRRRNGHIRLVENEGPGACFELLLPVRLGG